MSKPTTVLIVDDSRVSRMMIRAIVKNQYPDWQVIEAECGDDALSICVGHDEITLMVLDYNMPGMDGLTLAAHLREKYPNTVMSLLTANVQNSTRDKAAELDVNFAPKPITEDKVIEILKLVA